MRPVTLGEQLPANFASGLVFRPDPDFNGTETFNYTLTSADGTSETADVTINVAPVNDPPILDLGTSTSSTLTERLNGLDFAQHADFGDFFFTGTSPQTLPFVNPTGDTVDISRVDVVISDYFSNSGNSSFDLVVTIDGVQSLSLIHI